MSPHPFLQALEIPLAPGETVQWQRGVGAVRGIRHCPGRRTVSAGSVLCPLNNINPHLWWKYIKGKEIGRSHRGPIANNPVAPWCCISRSHLGHCGFLGYPRGRHVTSAVDIGPCDSGVALHCPTPDSVISVYPHINLNNAQETETTSLLKKKK